MEAFIASLGVVSILLGVWIVIFWPAFFLYALFRVLRDLRRIADSLEVRERIDRSPDSYPSPSVETEVVGGIQRISGSAFGR
jgi:hypothetical protein